MKKLLLTLAITVLSGLCMNSYIKEDVVEEFIVVEAEPVTEKVNNEIEIKIIEPTPTPIPTPDPVEVALQEVEQKMAEIESIEDEMEWFIAYKGIINEYYGILDPPETIWDYFTEDEVRLICKAVETECYQQNFESKCNVASVIFNRLEIGGEFGDSVEEVITSPNQFAYGRDAITEETILSVMYAFEIKDTTDGCIAFRSGKKPEKWYTTKTNYWELQFVDDSGHGFYK